MHLDPSSLVLTWPRLALVAALAALAVLTVVIVTGFADAALMAAAPPADGPLLAPFRWVPISGNLG